MPFVKERFYVKEEIRAFLFLIRHFGMSQGEAQRLISKGRILVNGISMMEKAGNLKGEIEIVYFEPKSRGNMPIFTTPDFAVFEKESGTLVHPKTMNTPYTLLDEIRTYAGDNANAIHRIDMETSGLVVASRNKKAESLLKDMFEKRKIQKSYLAWVDGKIAQSFQVDVPILVRDNYDNNKHKVCTDSRGKHSLTYFKPLYYDQKLDATLLSCRPHTGRTHQIRVHLFHVKHPILGDPIYGPAFESSSDYLDGVLTRERRQLEMGAERLLLHAESLKFHYKSDYEICSKVDFSEMKDLICDKEVRKFNKIKGQNIQE